MSDRCTTLSGSIDVPTLVPQPVVGLPFKNRLIDHFGAGRNIDSQAFEFFQQVSRSENAAPVADLGVKPTTTLTMQAVSGYAYFLATVTEPAPVRLLWHFPTVVDWLYTQLHGVIMDATEAQAISGNCVGTNQTGVRATRAVLLSSTKLLIRQQRFVRPSPIAEPGRTGHWYCV